MFDLKKTTIGLAAVAGLALSGGVANAAGELHLYNWSNYFSPDLMKKFEEENGVKVTLDTYSSDEDMMSKLKAGGAGYDIVFPANSTLSVMIGEGMLEKVDAKQLANFKEVGKPHDSPAVDPERMYSIPYMWGTTGLSYDSERVPGGKLEESWKEFFDPRPELVGQVAALNDVGEVYAAAAMYLGYDTCTESPEEAQAILDLLLAQKPKLKLYGSDGTIDRMSAGEVIMHHQWNGASHRTKKNRASVVYMYPKEGTIFWADNMAVPAGAPNKENALKFMNFMMNPENSAMASNYTGYMNGIPGSGPFLDDALKADPAVNMPVEYASRLVPAKPCSNAARELRDKVWTRLKK